MRRTSNIVKITRVVNRLFGAFKPNVTRSNQKEEYFKCYWFPHNLCNGIKAVADLERMMKAGLSSYMGQKITEQIKLDTAARKRNGKAKRTRFTFVLRKYAGERGMDISKFI